MLSRDPTFLGSVASVSGSSVSVHLAQSVASGLSMIEGRAYRIGQVGSFVRIPQGYQDLYGVVSGVGADAAPKSDGAPDLQTGRWMEVQLVGEATSGAFERGISQYPNVGDGVHITTETGLAKIYGARESGQIVIGALSSAESIPAKLSLNELVTRHSAILGSTGSGKSTTIASLLRSIVSSDGDVEDHPSARILMLDIHGEYSSALSDVANVFSVDPQAGEQELLMPYWALDASDLLGFLTGGVDGQRETAFTDKIFQLKTAAHAAQNFPGVQASSITVDTPLPFSLKQLWYDLIAFETATFEGPQRDQSTEQDPGNAEELIAPRYKPHAMGAQGPFLNQQALGIRRQLNQLRSLLLDRRYNFLLHPGDWEPSLNGTVARDLDELLLGWLGGPNPITILDLSGVPSLVLERMVGSILKVVYESMFWSREKSEGGISRPLLIVMEEAHRYLSSSAQGLASQVVQKIAKEGRKYGVGAMVISQRPSEVDETILSQCGTYFALRLTNPQDRARVQGTLPDGLVSLLEVLPVLRTGEAIIMGEAAKLPMRCRITLPRKEHRPKSGDPNVNQMWSIPRREEGYDRVVASWRAQRPRVTINDISIERQPVDDQSQEGEA
ncbi:ATP-binding protein [Ponticaulis sp.]|uniref:ATP-binding protein n=1 Tax=Ponticaulis sp. TaxID=2020902 RepID=UPI000B6B9D18|nr:ATP-binding protein [Ponticaulis sp.]MAI91311.1 ATPase [Ponticaulis sp.]OUX97913.1 MAG: ATPase [Hyphomonadaceae bacterium TMED5]|tara:strand:+ start:69618 stop:71459 length:1842 start_codon:yes stop_codon:yes gene_type:complete